MDKGYVLKSWMANIPWKQQSVLLSALRGPDLSRPFAIKKLNRWLRDVTQKNADPSSEYMKDKTLPSDEELKLELGYCTMHYFTHLMHALEIVGYQHPKEKTRDTALMYYSIMVEFVHLNPETKEEFNRRLEDKV